MLATRRHLRRLRASASRLLSTPARAGREDRASYQNTTATADPLLGSLRAFDPARPLLNFSPGPTSIPRPVMRQIDSELSSWQGCGLSAMELSHRSPEFLAIKEDCEATMRRVVFAGDNEGASEDFELLFCHGGGHAQFAAVPLNLCAAPRARAHYFITGTWSARAAAEAAKFCHVTETGSAEGWWQPPSELALVEPRDDNPAYAYICSNETVNGIEFFDFPDLPSHVPLCVDMSSDFCSKPVCYSKIGVAFACAPKNIGIPGLTVVLVRKSLLRDRHAQANTPGILDWSVGQANDCLWNTPATFNIYVTGLVMNWIEAEGGLVEMERRSRAKAELIYAAIDESAGFYATPEYLRVGAGAEAGAAEAMRSRMNVPFVVRGVDGVGVEEEVRMTEAFVKEAFERNIVGLRTQTPFGFGRFLRASLYNAVTVSDAETLAEFMRGFQTRHL